MMAHDKSFTKKKSMQVKLVSAVMGRKLQEYDATEYHSRLEKTSEI